MKRNYILKYILILTMTILTVDTIAYFLKTSGNYNNDNRVVQGKFKNLKSDTDSKKLETKSGYARDYYEKNGELYIVFDEVEFFRNEEARREYFKDGNIEEPMEEWGNDYYIRNNDKGTKVYKVSKDSKLELLAFEVGKNNSIKLVTVSPDKIKEKIDRNKNDEYLERGLLFSIDESDNVIYAMRTIFTP